MAVNTHRRSLREEQVRLTRLAVIEAAHRLFAERGYPTTSIRAVASEAGVSEQTVYRIFGDKAELLRAVVLTALGGPDDPRTLQESGRMAMLADGQTPEARLRIVADWTREAYERGLAQLEQIVLAAAPVDERVNELANDMVQQRYEDTRNLVLAILRDTQLPEGVELSDMVDYLYAVESSAVYTMLTEERGWTTDKYVNWFVHLVNHMFLNRTRDSPPRAPGSTAGVDERP